MESEIFSLERQQKIDGILKSGCHASVQDEFVMNKNNRSWQDVWQSCTETEPSRRENTRTRRPRHLSSPRDHHQLCQRWLTFCSIVTVCNEFTCYPEQKFSYLHVCNKDSYFWQPSDYLAKKTEYVILLCVIDDFRIAVVCCQMPMHRSCLWLTEKRCMSAKVFWQAQHRDNTIQKLLKILLRYRVSEHPLNSFLLSFINDDEHCIKFGITQGALNTAVLLHNYCITIIVWDLFTTPNGMVSAIDIYRQWNWYAQSQCISCWIYNQKQYMKRVYIC